jgi:hypothetical protein
VKSPDDQVAVSVCCEVCNLKTFVMSRKIPVPIKNISCQDLLRYQDSVHYGYLRKRCQVNKILEGFARTAHVIKWPNTFVVLRQGCLYIYSNEQSPAPSKASSLYGFSEACVCNELEVSANVFWAFKVVSELDLRSSILYFSAATEVDMQKWIRCIQEQIVYANGGVVGGNIQRSVDTTALNVRPAGSPMQRAAGVGKVPVRLPALPHQQQAAAPPQNLVPLDLEYDDGEFDSDYEHIIDSDTDSNETDDSKEKQCGGGNLPPAGAAQVGKFGTKNSSTESSSLVQPRTGPLCPEKPIVKPKPLDKKTPQHLQVNTSGPSVPMGCYSVEQQTNDGTAEEAAYVTNDEYPVFTGPSKTNLPPGEPLVNNAYWSGVSSEGESLLKKLNGNGIYMIRESKNEFCKETLLVLIEHELKRFRIVKTADGRYCLDVNGEHFDTRTELIRYYRTTCLPRLTATLSKPYTAYTSAR